MGRAINYDQAQQELTAAFELAERDFGDRTPMAAPKQIENAVNALFASKTQAFREVFIGCCLARIIDPEIDIRLPYMNQADNAYMLRPLHNSSDEAKSGNAPPLSY